jgi:transcription initiation factor TFIIE subunit beta
LLISCNFRVEKKARTETSKSSSSSSTSSAKKPLQPWESKTPKEPMNYKAMSGSSQKKFACLNKIVLFMKERHLQGIDFPISIDEIMDETNQLDVGSSTKNVI